MNGESLPMDPGRVAGAVAGALIGIVPGAVGLIEPDLDILVPAGVLGGITGSLLGARYGRQVRSMSGTEAGVLAVRMAVLAVVIGDLLASGVMALGSIGSGGPLEALVGLVALAGLGLLIFGLPALGLALVAGFAWVVVMRAVPARDVGGPSAAA
jgi:hypothetical protein